MYKPIVKIPNTVNPDLENERKKVTFNVEEFSEWWYGGKEKLKERRERETFFFDDPIYKDPLPISYMSHKEVYEHSIKQAAVVFRKIKKLQETGSDDIDIYMSLLGGQLGAGCVDAGNPTGVHFVMFLPTLIGQATTEQQAEFLGRAWSGEILGTYAQTELGHGTFIRGLETTATYDPKTEEFVLNSPTLTSYKWWPGNLGHTVNYAVVVAQLYSGGKCHGIHPFIVQLRHEETHMPLKGIHIGEIGNKLGMNGVNNGFLGFKNVRIPRKNMLMRNSQVLKDGTYVKSPSNVLTYGTMMFVRVVIVRDMANYLSKAVTVAIRYSAVRRQSPINPDLPEVQVIDHVTQQYKLFPLLAKSIVFRVTADDLWENYNQLTADLDKGNLERLPELHAISCCLKAVSTADSSAGVEKCRLACGGHGYLASSSFPLTYGTVTAAITYEGENTVLLLQTARFLIKAWASALKGEPLTPTVSYITHLIKYREPGRWDPSINGIIMALKTVAGEKIRLAYDNMERRKKAGATHEEAANQTSIELAHAADAHCRAFLVESGYKMIERAVKNLSPALSEVLRQLVELYAIEECIRAEGDLFRFTKITENDARELQSRLEQLLAKIRVNAVGIVDGFDIDDRILKSALGSYDGNVYERLFIEALKSPLNQEPLNKSIFELKDAIKSKL